MSLWRRILTPAFARTIFRQEINKRCLFISVYKNINITSKSVNSHPNIVADNTVRWKSKKAQYDSDDDIEEFDDDSSLSKDSKVVKISSTSMRTDVILKSALGVSRNKVEQMFYESKIRINGKKVLKKSSSLRLGDEVDVIKMVSPKNPNHIYVARIEILNVVPKEDSISVTARRFKNLLIENYEDDPHKAVAENE